MYKRDTINDDVTLSKHFYNAYYRRKDANSAKQQGRNGSSHL